MLLCWLQVRSAGGQLVLRVEDVDSTRARAEADAALHVDLAWLGFDWDEGPDVGGPFGPYRQSERTHLYEAALDALDDRLFSCSCTRKEVRAASEEGGELRYAGMCRDGMLFPDRPTSLRIRVEPQIVTWTDQAIGELSEDPSKVCGDFVLQGKNGDYNYQLACVVDDIAMGIPHVLRGEDLLTSTARQILLHRWLGAEPPTFAHVALRVDPSGERLAKSRGSRPIAAVRDEGQDPKEVLGSIAADLGLLEQAEAVVPSDLLAAFAARFPELIVDR